MNTVTNINNKIVGAFTGINILTVLGWLLFGLLIIGGSVWMYYYYKNKKLYNKKITAFEIVSGEWKPCIRDFAKTVKLGKGGFEILKLKKQKTWKVAYGGRVGKKDYYFFIMLDGYWYNGTLDANINRIDNNGGLIPIKTTNPLMRGQYTALEKQIDNLTGDKGKFLDKYGTAVMSIAFIVIAGVLLWLMFREFNSAMSKLVSYNQEHNQEQINVLKSMASMIKDLITRGSTGGSTGGLIPA